MKKLIPFFLCLLLLCGCHKAKEPLEQVSDRLGTDASDYTVTKYYDSHGGFHGDGETILVMELTEEQALRLDQDTENHFCRYDLPFSAPIEVALYGGTVIRGGVEWNHGSLFNDDAGHPLLPVL